MTRLAALLGAAAAFVAQNVGAILVVVGFVLFYRGASAFSRPLANALAGATMIVAGLYPYLRK